MCESYLKEEELQSHLFEGHQAENVEESFVRVSVTAAGKQPPSGINNNKSESLHICVVCWAKIPRGDGGPEDLKAHRAACRTVPADEEGPDTAVSTSGAMAAAKAAVSAVSSAMAGGVTRCDQISLSLFFFL